MEEIGLPCLEMLEATPAILRGLMCELSEDDARWKPAPDRFSVAEVLAHLSHSEGHCFRMRVDRFLREERPEFDADDAQMHLARRVAGMLEVARRLRPAEPRRTPVRCGAVSYFAPEVSV